MERRISVVITMQVAFGLMDTSPVVAIQRTWPAQRCFATCLASSAGRAARALYRCSGCTSLLHRHCCTGSQLRGQCTFGRLQATQLAARHQQSRDHEALGFGLFILVPLQAVTQLHSNPIATLRQDEHPATELVMYLSSAPRHQTPPTVLCTSGYSAPASRERAPCRCDI